MMIQVVKKSVGLGLNIKGEPNIGECPLKQIEPSALHIRLEPK